MIVVDSSVWIDLLNANGTPEALWLRDIFGKRAIAIPDLSVTEILQGARSGREFEFILALIGRAPVIPTTNVHVAVQAARNYRHLRSLGITVRKTVDTLIATRCIMHGHELLHNDRDFDPFVEHLGLRLPAI